MKLERDIDPALLAELAKKQYYPCALVHVDWPGAPFYGHSGVGEMSWDGKIWTGVGTLGAIDAPEESDGIVPEEIRLTLQADIASLLTMAAESGHRGRSVSLYAGATTEPGGTTLIGEPLSGFQGGITQTPYQLNADGSLSSISVLANSGPSARADASVVHSDADQQLKFPGDTFFRRVSDAEKFTSNPPTWPAP